MIITIILVAWVVLICVLAPLVGKSLKASRISQFGPDPEDEQ